MNLTDAGHLDPFPTTRWSHVLRASGNRTAASTALNELCGRYWRPIYAFVRRRGHAPHDAEDLTQAYFAGFLERGYLDRADQARGRFRAFLIHDLKYFLSNEQVKHGAAKRGGDVFFVPVDKAMAETMLDAGSLGDGNADAYFDREWALEIVRHARDDLAASFQAQGKAALFSVLQRGLVEPPTEEVYEAWSRETGMTPGALKVALHRLRGSFRTALESQVRETVADEADLRPEMQHLRRALSQTRGGFGG